jgi:trehalose 6-phosphate synthase
LILVHDLRYGDLRATQIKALVFGILALSGTAYIIFSLFYGRVAKRSWTLQVRNVLGHLSGATDLQRLLDDLKRMRTKLETEREARDEERLWTAARLQGLVNENLAATDLIVLANREPLIHERQPNGAVATMRPASGLVTALEPVVRACAGTWVAHGSGSADRDFVDSADRVMVPPAEAPFTLRRVWLSSTEEMGYYYGFSNEGLWPLCHIAHARPQFRSSDFAQYRDVNERFADAVAKETSRTDAVILVQDYHFALAPAMLRERLPHATIVMFWHIPWPHAERFSICPWRNELLEGMLGASIVGFHTQQHCNNFMESVDVLLEARIDRERTAVVRFGRPTLVRPYPISVEWPQPQLDAISPADARRELGRRYGLKKDVQIGLGIDRFDYTKGLEERLLAVENLIERYPEYRENFSFIQIAAPTRATIPRYREFAHSVVTLAREINSRFGTADWQPIILRHEHHDRESLEMHYRAADLCYVSSLHDGMNLVAKEFVAARNDEDGVLLLSRFTGSARELTEALIVNPYDIDEAADNMARALTMKPNEKRERMRAMRTHVREWNVFRWAGGILSDASQAREQTLLSHRLGLGTSS